MATAQKQLVKMAMSEDQLEAVEVFFAHQGWNIDILEQEQVVIPIHNLLREKIELHKKLSCSRESTPASSESDDSLGINKYIEIIDVKHLEFEDFLVDDDACKYCFWSPCVSTLRPNWLGNGAPAKDGNNMLRKDRYFKYVKTLAAKGCWKHPAYVLKKRDALDGCDGNKCNYVWAGNKYVREIIPECVVKLVRNLYPNYAGKSYDGEAPVFKVQEKK